MTGTAPSSTTSAVSAAGPGRDGPKRFVEEHWGRLYRTALLMVGDPAEAEDAVQSALVVVVERWSRIQRQDDPAGYAHRVMCRQIWRAGARRRMERERISRVGRVAQATQTDRISPVDDRHLLVPALQRLPIRMRTVLVLRYFADMTESQAATQLGCSVGTVKSQTSKALVHLRNELGEATA